MKITKKTKISDVIKNNPKAAELLFNVDLMCVGCPMAMQETIEQGCLAHGIDKTEIKKLLKELNKK